MLGQVAPAANGALLASTDDALELREEVLCSLLSGRVALYHFGRLASRGPCTGGRGHGEITSLLRDVDDVDYMSLMCEFALSSYKRTLGQRLHELCRCLPCRHTNATLSERGVSKFTMKSYQMRNNRKQITRQKDQRPFACWPTLYLPAKKL